MAATVETSHLVLLYEKQSGLCAILGIPMVVPVLGMGQRGRQDNGISLDRIDPRRGYTNENVQLVCWLANRMRNNLSLPRFIEVCKLVAARFP